MGNVNCLRCHFRHEDNGTCVAVNRFCTAVPAAHCPLLRQYLDTGMTPEAFQSFVVFLQYLIGNQVAGFVDKSIFGVPVDEIDKTVFLTNEEAKKALEAMKDAK